MKSPPKGDPREPNLSFSHAIAKVRWAEHKLGNLNSAVQKLFQAYREAGGINFDPASNAITIPNEMIPPWVALEAGDIAFSLRSALDCCWMGLKRAIDAEVDKGTLPRADTRKEVEGSIKQASVENAFQGSDAFILDRIQPYRDGKETLWFLGKVDNWNKHNMLLLTIKGTKVQSYSGTVTAPDGSTFPLITEDNDFSGDAPFNLITFGKGMRFEPDAKPNVTFDIILVSRKPADKRSLLPFLGSALKETAEAVELFFSTFGKKEP